MEGASSKPFHDIPMSRRGVLEALLAELDDVDERGRFRRFSKRLGAIYHYEFHERLEHLKEAYEPVNPDHGALLNVSGPGGNDRHRLEERLAEVLEHGNYRRLSREELDFALSQHSVFPIAVQVDFEVFEEMLVFARGESPRKATLKTWFGLRSKEIDVVAYDRVCMYLRFKPAAELSKKEKAIVGVDPGMTFLKLFRNIPKADIEMLFPNTRLKMRTFDKLVIGVPAVVGGVPVLLKLAPVLFAFAVMVGMERGEVNLASLVAGLSGLVGLSFFLFRQVDKFKSRKLLFMRMLSESLYFLNIDNNEGVITRLIDEAEEEEHKEALLAYHFLRQQPGLDEEALDHEVEQWLEVHCDAPVDFEIDDAVDKLLRFELATKDDEGGLRVVPLDDAIALLDGRWSAFLTADD